MELSQIDIVGDVHGQFDALDKLLKQLEYGCSGQQWSHPKGRTLLFLGDLIDRGPKCREVVQTVRALVEQGIAICLMGNHEFNAVQYHTEYPDSPGEYIRPHTEIKNIEQHKEFMNSYAGHEAEINSVIAWFSTLPVAIETSAFRAVHACWSSSHLNNLRKEGNAWYMDALPWVDAADENHKMFKTIEILLKGPEVKLPNGLFFMDKDKNKRHSARVSWWKECPKTWCEAVDSVANINRQLDGIVYDGEAWAYSESQKPVFFGHYWRTGEVQLDSPNTFCVDYSAGNGGPLTAYRFDASHSELSVDHIRQVNVRDLQG